MVLIAEKKYACEACIKGHRASVCQHTDRPLFEIKRKGRPVSQCQHCRELRKTKQVHVKCMCALRNNDSDYASSSTCECDRTGECHCCTTRTPYSGRKPKARDLKAYNTPPGGASSSESRVASPAGIVDAAHVDGHRPLLPKPTEPQQRMFAEQTQTSAHAAGAAESSQQIQPFGHSCCSHAGSYEHGHPPLYTAPSVAQEDPLPNTVSNSYSYDDPVASTGDLSAWLTMFDPAHNPEPGPTPSWSIDNISLCECGSGCGCAGCAEDGARAATSPRAGSCGGTHACASCLDCALVSVLGPEELDVPRRVGGNHERALGGRESRVFDVQSFDVQLQSGPSLTPASVFPNSFT